MCSLQMFSYRKLSKKIPLIDTFNRIDEYLFSLFSVNILKKLHYFCIIYQRKIKQEGFVFDFKMLFYKFTVQCTCTV
jgi:hypothetical protein